MNTNQQLTTPPHPTPTFETLPPVIYREILSYLSPSITTLCDIKPYLDLQRCCNPTFAASVRAVIKKPLQLVQAAISLNIKAAGIEWPNVRHNPSNLAFLTFSDICDKYNIYLPNRYHAREFAILVTAWLDFHHKRYAKVPKREVNIFRSESMDVRIGETLETLNISGVEYKLCRGVRQRTQIRQLDVITLDWGIFKGDQTAFFAGSTENNPVFYVTKEGDEYSHEYIEMWSGRR